MSFIDLPTTQDNFQLACLILAGLLLIWDCFEVGRNDAANIINSVIGARILRRRSAVALAGIAVILGAVLSSDVIDTARKGIFDPTGLSSLQAALVIYTSVYIVDTVLLYGYSAFGMPVSTTACLVFELMGAAMAVNIEVVRWGKSGLVFSGIICSIILTGLAAFFIQRAARGAIHQRTDQLSTMLLHGGWVGGGMAAGLCYFLVFKGMKDIKWIAQFKDWLHGLNGGHNDTLIGILFLAVLWGIFSILIHLFLVIYRKRAAKLLFPILCILGMVSMAFAFGQNDLANCASPGLSVFTLLQKQSLEIGSKIPIAWWMLLGCGILLALGMSTKNAQRVTKAEISVGSSGDYVALWAPRWCIAAAKWLLRFRGKAPALSPRADITLSGKTTHYDPLRASVIMSVSASIIATASSLGLPVSTTYVAFVAVVATGMADRIFQRGDADLKLGRAIWVVASWGISALIAIAAAFLVATIVLRWEISGAMICLMANFIIRRFLRNRADRQALRVKEEIQERIDPDAFALEEEDD